jgi:phosphinothricin acetyltransferase
MHVIVRPATLNDLPGITEIHNHYIVNTHITFDIQPYVPEQRASWFNDHSDGNRYRMVVACDAQAEVLGYACTGRHRNKQAYDTTVESSVGCRPEFVGRGLGSRLYAALFEVIADQDINRIVAGIAQPNAASNALHEKFGFKTVGTYSEVGRKFGKYWDVMWLERPLLL